VDLDFDAAKSEAKVAAPKAKSNQPVDSEVVLPFGSFAPKRPAINRRVLLFGAVGAAALIGILAITFRRHAPAPARIGVAARTSATVADVPAAPVNSGNTPSASASVAAPQPAPEVSVAAAAQPEQSAATAVEDDVKIPVNIKPDGALLLYKGKVVGRTPFILKQPRGEKRTYEVGKPGYATRRVYVTGTERTIGFELGLDVPHPDSL
jgi:hypothetical protein